MLYKDIPYHHVYMKRQAIDCELPKDLPDFFVEHFTVERAEDWCHVQVASGHVASMQEAMVIFKKTFLTLTYHLEERIFLLYHKSGEVVGTITLWDDVVKDVMMKRLHWLAIKDSYAQRGLANYLVEMLCAICKEELFLSTQTWSYPAIHIYLKHGFLPYNPYNEEDFDRAWDCIHKTLQR